MGRGFGVNYVYKLFEMKRLVLFRGRVENKNERFFFLFVYGEMNYKRKKKSLRAPSLVYTHRRNVSKFFRYFPIASLGGFSWLLKVFCNEPSDSMKRFPSQRSIGEWWTRLRFYGFYDSRYQVIRKNRVRKKIYIYSYLYTKIWGAKGSNRDRQSPHSPEEYKESKKKN